LVLLVFFPIIVAIPPHPMFTDRVHSPILPHFPHPFKNGVPPFRLN
jgi:hypothetical protein